MSVVTVPQTPAYFSMAGFHQLSVAKYHKMIEAGILADDDRIELLEGYMVQRMPPNPPHSNSVSNAAALLASLAPRWLALASRAANHTFR
jgi:hypothetical protein